MKVLSLFSGIGAFEKALENMGIPFDLVAYCDFDKYASKSYAAIHGVPETMNLGDITKVDEKKLPKDIDLITYGFPCQDISLAGKQKGLFNADGSQTRSGLFFEALRIIEETQPKVAIAENVKNLTSKKFALQFKIVLDSLKAAGYNNYFQILNAKDYGIPQNRERVFIVSIRKDIDNGAFKFPEGFPLELRLKDMLEDVVDDKYYISKSDISFITKPIASDCIQVAQMYGTEREPNPQAGRVYDANGISPTMDSCSGGNRMPKVLVQNGIIKVGNVNPSGKGQNGLVIDSEGLARTVTVEKGEGQKILVREATKAGYAEAAEGDSINFEQPNSKTRRGRVGKQIAQTLNTTCYLQGVVVNEPNVLFQRRTEYGKEIRKAYESGEVTEKWGNMKEFVPRTDGIANTLTSVQKDNYLQDSGLRIRKLTPKECFRLMGFDDASFAKAEAVNSNSQLYKQAGNSIVVPVVEGIIHSLLDCGVLK